MAAAFRRMIQTVDSHTEGNSTRVITGGYPVPPGRTLLERRAWLWRHDDGLRRMLNFEPRGHGMMCSVLLMPPVDERADFSVIIMEQDEYVPMCGHCMIGTAMTVVATGMVLATEPLTTVVIETPAGLVRCEVKVQGGRVGGVSFTNVESFLLHRDAEVEVEGFGRGSARHRLWRRLLCDRRCRPAGAATGARQRRGADRGGAAHHPRGEPAARHPPSRAAGHQSLLSDPLHVGRDRHGRSQADHRLPAGLARSQPLRHRHLGARRGAARPGRSCRCTSRCVSKACSAPALPARRSRRRSGQGCSTSLRKSPAAPGSRAFTSSCSIPRIRCPEAFGSAIRHARRLTRSIGAERDLSRPRVDDHRSACMARRRVVTL